MKEGVQETLECDVEEVSIMHCERRVWGRCEGGGVSGVKLKLESSSIRK